MIRRLAARFRAWSTLRAWRGKDLSSVTVTLTRSSDPSKRESTGYCTGDRIHVTVGRDAADARATLLHEMAHAAAFALGQDYGHGTAWRAIFEAAAAEVFRRKRIVHYPASYSADELTAHVADRFHKRLRR